MSFDAALRAPLERWLARRHGPTGGVVTLRYRRVYILPTRAGFAFGALLMLIWLGAINYSNNLAFMLTFLLAGVAIAGMHHAFHNLVGLRVEPGRPASAFAGQHVSYPLTLGNDRATPRTAIELSGGDGSSAVDVPGCGTASAALPIPSTRRGRLGPGRISIATRYPTGLFRAWSWVEPAGEAIIYPTPEAGRVPPPGDGGDGTRGRSTEGDTDFAGLRRFQRGDSPRRIAWKATHARELQVKVFASNASEAMTLDWTATAGLGHEQRISRLCRWVLDADQAGYRYALELPGQRLPPSAGPAHRHRCLAALAGMP